MDTTCWPHGLHMVVQGRVHSSQHGPSVELYKVDQFVEEFSIEFSCVTQYKKLFYYPILRIVVYNTLFMRHPPIRHEVLIVTPAMTSTLNDGNVLKALSIHIAALLCILPNIFSGYDNRALLQYHNQKLQSVIGSIQLL